MSKKGPTPPAPQNRRRRAEFFMDRLDDPKSKPELLRLAIDQEIKQQHRPKSLKKSKGLHETR